MWDVATVVHWYGYTVYPTQHPKDKHESISWQSQWSQIVDVEPWYASPSQLIFQTNSPEGFLGTFQVADTF